MATRAEKAETKYNNLLERRDKLREEIIEAKKDLDSALEEERAAALLESSGLQIVDGKVQLRTIAEEAVPGSEAAPEQDEEEEEA